MNIKKIFLFALGTLVFSSTLGIAGKTFAQQGAFVSLTNNQQVQGAPMLSSFFGGGGSTNSLPDFFNTVFTAALSIGAILAVLRITYAGWVYMSTDAMGKKGDAKEILRDAIIGLLLLFGIWLILNQINPDLLNLDILRSINTS